jgi:hypothetical protein
MSSISPVKKSISKQFLELRNENPRAGASIRGKNFSLFYHHKFSIDCNASFYNIGFTLRSNRYTYMAEMTLDEYIQFFSNEFIDVFYYMEEFSDTEFIKKIDSNNKFEFVGDDCD